jgi:hypothetical protein
VETDFNEAEFCDENLGSKKTVLPIIMMMMMVIVRAMRTATPFPPCSASLQEQKNIVWLPSQ